ncbi:glycosyl hydrolase catalytic core-domain-containing protein [Xylariales sp. PMI_506]|nr:glycosyl hydrolase catalytic core-domain-containing protein [Xylariales sp. PMI_506]
MISCACPGLRKIRKIVRYGGDNKRTSAILERKVGILRAQVSSLCQHSYWLPTTLCFTQPIAMTMRHHHSLCVSFLISFFLIAIESVTATTASKRGLAYLGDPHQGDLNLLLSEKSPISWYYTWSLNQAQPVNTTVPFLPLVTNTDDASNSDLIPLLSQLPASATHLLTFNEPDGSTDSGGSAISPDDAASSYLEYIVPLRNNDTRRWNISHPVVTGSSQGLTWLQDFNASCYKLDPSGCPTDFVAVHWYGDFAGLASWLGTLSAFYNPNNDSDSTLEFWVTEMALPQADEETTASTLNQSIAYLDGLDYVSGYAWFGDFREDDSNEWTGESVAFFDNNGGLTEVGSLYLGGSQNGFAVGVKGQGAASTLSVSAWAVAAAGVAMVMMA